MNIVWLSEQSNSLSQVCVCVLMMKMNAMKLRLCPLTKQTLGKMNFLEKIIIYPSKVEVEINLTMAQAEFDPDSVTDDPRKVISILMLSTKWTFDTCGLSTINKSIVNNLRLVDPNAKTIRITCAVLEEQGKISQDQIHDADNYKVNLVGYKHPRGPRKSPNIEWLNQTINSYYNHLTTKQKFDFIIGHGPHLVNGCFTLKDSYTERKHQAKVILMVHSLPRVADQVDCETLEGWLEEADTVFSVGKAVQSELQPYINGLDQEQRPLHKLYVPGFPVELLGIMQEPRGNTVQGTQYISMMTGEPRELDIPGLDFRLAVSACAKASEHIRTTDDARVKLALLGMKEEHGTEFRSWFSEINRDQGIQISRLSFECPPAENVDRIKRQLKRSNLFIQPLVSDSILFGVEALSAAAAGVPILVSQNAGVVSALGHNMIVRHTSNESLVETWKDEILRKILRPKEAQHMAMTFREQLLLDTSISKTHLDFINTIAGKFIFLYFAEYVSG